MRRLLLASLRRSSASIEARPILEAQVRALSSDTRDKEFVALNPGGKPHNTNTTGDSARNALNDIDDIGDEDAEETVEIGPSGVEYGGPTLGGKLMEPTRFGDWERKGRCSDF